MKTWPCRHMAESIPKGQWVFTLSYYIVVTHQWSFCPICGAKRPQPKKHNRKEGEK